MSAKITMPLDKARVIVKRIQALYPDAHCELIHDNVFQLLIAVMLSAQATDVSVNKVTPALFERFPTPEAFLQASPKEIEPYIQTIGLYRNKAKFIYQCCEQLMQRYGGEVPRTRAVTTLLLLGAIAALMLMSVIHLAGAVGVRMVEDSAHQLLRNGVPVGHD